MRIPGAVLLFAILLVPSHGQGLPSPRGPFAATWDAAYAPHASVRRTSAAAHGRCVVARDGKLMCGYQGWFLAKGDGSGAGWVHFGPGEFRPGRCTVDLWPDMSEAGPDECYPTDFHHADGSIATVFSSYNAKTVDRHFKWMADYGIDGAFLQRFAVSLRSPQDYDHLNAVLDNVRQGANNHGRTWTVMYDLSGLDKGEIESVVMADWKRLTDRMAVDA